MLIYLSNKGQELSFQRLSEVYSTAVESYNWENSRQNENLTQNFGHKHLAFIKHQNRSRENVLTSHFLIFFQNFKTSG